MGKKKQVRITIPSWITDLKGWNKNSNLQIIPIVKENDDGVTKDTVFVIKEVKKKK